MMPIHTPIPSPYVMIAKQDRGHTGRTDNFWYWQGSYGTGIAFDDPESQFHDMTIEEAMDSIKEKARRQRE